MAAPFTVINLKTRSIDKAMEGKAREGAETEGERRKGEWRIGREDSRVRL